MKTKLATIALLTSLIAYGDDSLTRSQQNALQVRINNKIKSGLDQNWIKAGDYDIRNGFLLKNTICNMNFDNVKSSMAYDEKRHQSTTVLSELALHCFGHYNFQPLTDENRDTDRDSFLYNVDNVAMTILVSTQSP